MQSNTLVRGYFIKRYKRFLVDVKLEDGSIVTAHCTNSGSLKSCIVPNAPVILSVNNNPKRKTRYTWELIKIDNTWVGVNTSAANQIANELLSNKILNQFGNITLIKREVKWNNSRIDFYIETKSGDKFFIEVKNVTYRYNDYALFPDAKTVRGQKHLQELMLAIDKGYKAAMLYIIQRSDTKIFAPAKEIDPHYATLLKSAADKGVKILPAQIKQSPDGWKFVKLLEYEL